jgi:hypothetical protein
MARLNNAGRWTPDEDAKLTAFYPKGGAYTVNVVLPHRTLTGIRTRAHLLGVLCGRGKCSHIRFKPRKTKPKVEHIPDPMHAPFADWLKQSPSPAQGWAL